MSLINDALQDLDARDGRISSTGRFPQRTESGIAKSRLFLLFLTSLCCVVSLVLLQSFYVKENASLSHSSLYEVGENREMEVIAPIKTLASTAIEASVEKVVEIRQDSELLLVVEIENAIDKGDLTRPPIQNAHELLKKLSHQSPEHPAIQHLSRSLKTAYQAYIDQAIADENRDRLRSLITRAQRVGYTEAELNGLWFAFANQGLDEQEKEQYADTASLNDASIFDEAQPTFESTKNTGFLKPRQDEVGQALDAFDTLMTEGELFEAESYANALDRSHSARFLFDARLAQARDNNEQAINILLASNSQAEIIKFHENKLLAALFQNTARHQHARSLYADLLLEYPLDSQLLLGYALACDDTNDPTAAANAFRKLLNNGHQNTSVLTYAQQRLMAIEQDELAGVSAW